MSKLSSDFVVELLKYCIKDERIGDVVMEHMKYSYFPSDEHKHIYRSIESYTKTTNTLITEGILAEEHKSDPKRRDLLLAIREAELPNKDVFLVQFEKFIKDTMFVKAYDKSGELFNQGKKDEAMEHMKTEGENIHGFSIKSKYFTEITSKEEFKKRREDRKGRTDSSNSQKIPTPIPQLNDATDGGVNKGDTLLVLAQSGVGKSKYLRSQSLLASQYGFKGLHISAEGTRIENEDAFDTAMAKSKLWRTERNKMHKEELEELGAFFEHVENMEGQLFFEAFEQFDAASIRDVRNILIEIEKNHGKLDFLCLDYFELFDPGDGRKYSASNDQERKRRESIGNALKNLAVEFNIAIFTATQASTVESEKLNDPNFVQTRYNISEFKGVIKPFSYFLTFNQTKDEKENNAMRIWADKVRKYKVTDVWMIATMYEHETFCDEQKTIEINGLT